MGRDWGVEVEVVMPREPKLRLSWQQIAWALSLLLGLGGAWVDLRVQMTKMDAKVDAITTKIDLTKQYDDFQRGKFEERVKALEVRKH